VLLRPALSHSRSLRSFAYFAFYLGLTPRARARDSKSPTRPTEARKETANGNESSADSPWQPVLVRPRSTIWARNATSARHGIDHRATAANAWCHDVRIARLPQPGDLRSASRPIPAVSLRFAGGEHTKVIRAPRFDQKPVATLLSGQGLARGTIRWSRSLFGMAPDRCSTARVPHKFDWRLQWIRT
jgi:hypothetical protein